ncbi:MAG: hypothetical protein ORN83_05420 [Chthoniobacteraceae bacterium]|nr:hypothetical protein [Chthoniobacteraceae bacterium]
MTTATATLASALRILADDIESHDNVPALCLMEAADRLESLATELGWRTLERDQALAKLKRVDTTTH